MKMSKPWKAWFKKVQRSSTCAAYPVWDQSWPPWSSARSTASSASPSAQKLCGYAGLCPSTQSSGGKTFQGKLLRHCNKWLRWAFVEAAWVAIGCSAYFGDFYKRKRALGKKPSLAILATARLMARITRQLLTQRRAYTSLVETQYLRSQPAERIAYTGGVAKEVQKPLKDPSNFPRRRLSQPLQNNAGWSLSPRL